MRSFEVDLVWKPNSRLDSAAANESSDESLHNFKHRLCENLRKGTLFYEIAKVKRSACNAKIVDHIRTRLFS